MTWFRIVAGVVLAAVIGGVVYVWAALSGVFVQQRAFSELKALLEPALQIHKPAGAGPFPTVLAFPGCAGVRRAQGFYADRAVTEGVMTIVVDSLGPRNISYQQAVDTVCSGLEFRGGERAGDVWAALDLAREMEDVDPERLAIVGWSHGGWSIMDALTFDPDNEQPYGLKDGPTEPFAGVVGVNLYYPYASFPARTKSHGWTRLDIPVQALIVTGDTTADPDAIRQSFDALQRAGVQIDIDEIDDVTHGFDEDDHHPDSPHRYDPAATREALADYGVWLRETFNVNADPPMGIEADGA